MDAIAVLALAVVGGAILAGVFSKAIAPNDGCFGGFVVYKLFPLFVLGLLILWAMTSGG